MRKIKLFCDPMLSLMAFIYPIALLMLYFGTIATAIVHEASKKDLYTCIIFFGVLIILNLLPCIYCLPIWFAHVELDKDGISLHKGFKKTPKERYENFNYFKIASYVHIFSTRYFVVIGKKGLSMEELVHINKVRVSEEIIKIKLNKKSYFFLMECLPEHQRNILKNSAGEGFKKAKSEVNVYTSVLRRKAREQKRKLKWKKKRH